MANTLTNLIPTLYEALDKVSRELVGFIPAVRMNSTLERAAKDQTIRIPIVGDATTANITPAQTAPDTGDATVTNTTITISKSKMAPIRWNGEERVGLGTMYDPINVARSMQAMRALTNEVEADLGGLYTRASLAFGTSATTPFGTVNEFDDAAEVFRILDENGAPQGDRHLVVDPAAMAKLRGYQTVVTHANEAGDGGNARRTGDLGPLLGFNLHTSGQVQQHTAGSATGYDANGGEPAAETTLAVDGSDSGTILAGDVITWASGPTEKYVVVSATASGAASGNIVIQSPGLRSTLATTVEGTTSATYRANMAFDRDAIQLVTRMPALPDGGDAADDRTTITDPNSGLSFDVAIYREYHQVHIEIGLAWGYAAIKPEHIALLLG